MRTKTMLRAAAVAAAGALVWGGIAASATSWSQALPGSSVEQQQEVELLARQVGIKWWK